MEKFKYYVEQQYFNKGENRIRILTSEQAEKLGYYDGYTKETYIVDTYVEGVNSLEEAERIFYVNC